MKCEKCEQQTKFWKYKLESGGTGCTSSYHCYQCHTTYIADTTKANNGTQTEGVVYISGPCACGMRCRNEVCKDKIPVMLEPGVSFYQDIFKQSGFGITGMPWDMQWRVADDKIKEACLVRSTKEDGFRL